MSLYNNVLVLNKEIRYCASSLFCFLTTIVKIIELNMLNEIDRTMLAYFIVRVVDIA